MPALTGAQSRSRGRKAHAVPDATSLEMIRLYAEEGVTFEQLGSRFHMTRQAVDQRLKPWLTTKQRTQAKTQRRKLKAAEREATIAPLRSQVRRLALAGRSNTEIQLRLDIAAWICNALVAELTPGERKRREAAKKYGETRYSHAQKIAALREAAALNYGRISVNVYRRLRATHLHWPSVDLLIADGWNRLVREAGLVVWSELKPKKGIKPLYSEADCRRAARRVGKVVGGVYSLTTYDRLRLSTEPSSGTLRLHHGGDTRRWVETLEYLAPQLFKNSSQVSPRG